MTKTTETDRATVDPHTAARRVARTLIQRALGFRDCRPETLDALVAEGYAQKLGRGEVLVRQGGGFDILGIITAGALEAGVLRRDGHRHLFSFLMPGDVIGIISMLDGLGHMIDLIAKTRGTELLLIRGDVVRRLRESDPTLIRAMELQTAFRSRLLYERMAGDTSVSLDVRLARLLQTLSGLYGLKRPEGVVLAMKISQADLGDFLGVSRQRANYAAQRLKQDGLILLSYSAITITDPAGLAERARI